jgi:hypothetical protein
LASNMVRTFFGGTALIGDRTKSRRLRVTMNWAEKHSALETCIASSKSSIPNVKARCRCSDPVGGTMTKEARRRRKGRHVRPPK